jgi:glutathione S-transferase
LVPQEVGERVAVLGLSREIIGRHGIGWARRLMMLAPLVQQPAPPPGILRLARRYGCDEQAPQAVPSQVARILEHLAAVLERQHAAGSRYFVGSALSAVDVYWACFSNMLVPLPAEACAMPSWMRQAYGDIGEVITTALDPSLIAHRDFVFAEHIGLPLDFAIDPVA